MKAFAISLLFACLLAFFSGQIKLFWDISGWEWGAS
jgi:hypothetical protein